MKTASWDRAFNLWDLMLSPGRQRENWVKLQDTQMTLQRIGWWGKKPHILWWEMSWVQWECGSKGETQAVDWSFFPKQYGTLSISIKCTFCMFQKEILMSSDYIHWFSFLVLRLMCQIKSIIRYSVVKSTCLPHPLGCKLLESKSQTPWVKPTISRTQYILRHNWVL